MDSITQIALGAAVGEAVLGKKIGNRAMVWGAVGGTIPDLDIIANFFTDEITALAFHRAITHSFFFAMTFPFLAGWLIEKLYSSGLYRNKGYKLFVFIGMMFFYSVVAGVISFIPVITGGDIYFPPIIVSILLGCGLGYWINQTYYKRDLDSVDANWKDWSWLMFWAIFTHPLLDCCTAYGTQVFQPFSDYRVAFNNVSVVDPAYTLPLIFGCLLAARLVRHSHFRMVFNYAGIALSCLYLVFTFWNKERINTVFEQTMASQNIVAERYMTSPVFFSNALWNCLAETEDAYYYGRYSTMQEDKVVRDLVRLPKNHELLSQYNTETDRVFYILKWFSNGYYNVLETEEGLQLNDLRFGLTCKGQPNYKQYAFRFHLWDENGKLQAEQRRENDKPVGELFQDLWNLTWAIEPVDE